MQVRRTVDPYAILGVSRDATPLQVARAHRQLAKRHHPDLQGADAAIAAAEPPLEPPASRPGATGFGTVP